MKVQQGKSHRNPCGHGGPHTHTPKQQKMKHAIRPHGKKTRLFAWSAFQFLLAQQASEWGDEEGGGAHVFCFVVRAVSVCVCVCVFLLFGRGSVLFFFVWARAWPRPNMKK